MNAGKENFPAQRGHKIPPPSLALHFRTRDGSSTLARSRSAGCLQAAGIPRSWETAPPKEPSLGIRLEGRMVPLWGVLFLMSEVPLLVAWGPSTPRPRPREEMAHEPERTAGAEPLLGPLGPLGGHRKWFCRKAMLPWTGLIT